MAKSLHQALFLFLLCTGLAFLHELARAAPISLSTKHTDLLSVTADHSQLTFHTSTSSPYPAPVYLSAGLVRFQPEHFANDPIDPEPTWHESPSDYVTLERRFDLGGWFRNAFHKVGEAFKTAGQKIKEGFQKVGEGIKHVAQKVGDGIKTAANKVKEGFQTAGRKIKEGFQTAGTKIKEGFQTAGKKIKEGFQTAGRKMKEGFQTAGRWIKDTGAKVAKFGLKVAGTITAVASHIVRFIPGVGTAASAALKGATFGLNKASDAIHADLGDKLNKGMHVMDIIQDPIGYAVHKAAEGAIHHVENHIQAHKPGAPHPAPPYVHHASQDPHHNPPPGYHDPHHPPPYHVAVPGATHHPAADHHQAAPPHAAQPHHPVAPHLSDPHMHGMDHHSVMLSQMHQANHAAAHQQPQHHEAQHHAAVAPPAHHEAQHHAAPPPQHHEAAHHAAAPPPPAHHPAPAHHH